MINGLNENFRMIKSVKTQGVGMRPHLVKEIIEEGVIEEVGGTEEEGEENINEEQEMLKLIEINIRK